MKILNVTVACGVLALAGCAGMLPPTQVVRFSNDKAVIAIERVGCNLERGQYADTSGRGHAHPFFKVIAVSNSGATVGQWFGSCEAVTPNGSSSCLFSGPKRAAFECGNIDHFEIVN
jgi:hypothetical protein